MKFFFLLLICSSLSQDSVANADAVKPSHPTAITITFTVVNSTCQKENGKISVQASGGVAPYDYDIGLPYVHQSSGNFYRILAGTYTIIVTDAIGQVATQTATVNNLYLKPKATVVSKTKPSGCATFDATLTLQGSIGPAPYTYTLDGYNFQTSDTYNNLTAGAYSYAVKDANGCTSNDDNTVLFPAFINPNCSLYQFGWAGGGSCNPMYLTWTITPPTGGMSPYTYSKDGINYQTSNFFDSVPLTSIFTVWIKDATGSILLTSISRIIEHSDCFPFIVTTTTTAALCGQNGSITAIASEGTSPYQYSLDGITYQASNVFTGLAPGNYTVTIKDFYELKSAILANVANNCVIAAATTTSSTCSNSNGKITVQASNGTAPYKFSLDGVNFTTNNIFINLAAANYIVYAKDATGATGTANVIISNIAGPQINAINVTATGCDNHSGSIAVAGINGTAPLSYSIDGIVFQNAAIFNGIAQGGYTVNVKDANGCMVTSLATVPMSGTAPTVNFGSDLTLCEGNTLLLDATNINATYLWQDNSTNPTYLVTQAGKYFVTVTKQGCIAKDTIAVNYNLKPKFTLGADSRICMGTTIVLDPKISGVNYLWQDGSTNATYTVTQPGLYSLTATNTCGPTTASVTIGTGICDLYIPNSFTPNGDAKNDLFKAGYGDNVTEFHMQVFNRYGQLVFESKDKGSGWDGNFKGSHQPYGTYVWQIQYKTAVDNNLQKLQGTVLLIR